MRKIIVLMLLLLTACAKEPVEVPVLIYDVNDAYMDDYQRRMVEAGIENGILQVYDGQHSQTIQNEQIDTLLQKGLPLLLINPVDRLSAHAIIQKAKENDTAIIFFNREPLQSDLEMYDKAYYVGADAKQSAQLQATLIMEMFGNNPNELNEFDKNNDQIIQAVILKGQQGHQDAEQRSKYVIDTLIQAGYQVEVLETAIANFDEQEGYQQMSRLIDVYGNDIEVVISNNDAMAIGAIKALVEKEMMIDTNNDGSIDSDNEPWVGVVGIDGLDRAIELLKTNHLYGTVQNDSQEMVEIILQLADWILLEKDLNDFETTIDQGHYVWVDYKIISIEHP